MTEQSTALTTPSPKNGAMTMTPKTFDEAFYIAEILAKSNLLPADIRGNKADIFMICSMGWDMGLSFTQSIQGIYVVKGRPSLATDTMIALILQSGLAEYWYCVETSDTSATYETKRGANPKPQSVTYTIAQAKSAGRLEKTKSGRETPWHTDPADMLRRRAASKLARMVYPDVIGGFMSPEEVAEIAIDVTPGPKLDDDEIIQVGLPEGAQKFTPPTTVEAVVEEDPVIDDGFDEEI